jgi:hypothetical protein
MNDSGLENFETWFKEELKALEPLDAGFSQQVLAKTKINCAANASTQRTTAGWNTASLLVCTVAIGTLLLQTLSQIDAELLSGPILESLVLLVSIMAASWQCQKFWCEAL